jgi:hypothetical protein
MKPSCCGCGTEDGCVVKDDCDDFLPVDKESYLELDRYLFPPGGCNEYLSNKEMYEKAVRKVRLLQNQVGYLRALVNLAFPGKKI